MSSGYYFGPMKVSLMLYPTGGMGSNVCSKSKDEQITEFTVNCESNNFFGGFMVTLNLTLVLYVSVVGFVKTYRKLDHRIRASCALRF